MIQISNINIKFDKDLIKNSEITLNSGKITGIKGESGSGKSSLLYIVGLLVKRRDIYYKFENHVISYSDEELSLYRKNYIGYVFQDNSLIEHLSIFENIQLYCSMTNEKITEQEAIKLLHIVNLNKNIHQDIASLSGGEKQRLAIACAFSKKPSLLILDEPTSALDKENMQVIMDILKKLAGQGMTIFIASHDENVISQCDVIYEIIDKRLVRNQRTIDDSNKKVLLSKKNSPLGMRFFLDYCISYIKRNKYLYITMFIMCGLVIAALLGTNKIAHGFEKKQQINMDNIGFREVFVTSSTNDLGEAKYNVSLNEISETKIKRIEQSLYCENVYPFYEGTVYKMSIGNQTLERFIAIQPYTAERNLNSYAEITTSIDNGIYLSYSLLDLFEKNDMTASINLSLFLPDGTSADINDLTVSGILKSNVKNWYSDSRDVIYVPIDKFPKFQSVQALIIYSTHFDTCDYLKNEIQNIDKQFGVFSLYNRGSYLSEALHSMKSFTPFIISMLIIITTILLFLIFSRYIANRKHEICLLKANGLNNHELTKLVAVEMVIQSFSISATSVVFSSILYLYMSRVLSINIEIDVPLLFVLSFAASFILMMVPSFITLLTFRKYDPATLLRND